MWYKKILTGLGAIGWVGGIALIVCGGVVMAGTWGLGTPAGLMMIMAGIFSLGAGSLLVKLFGGEQTGPDTSTVSPAQNPPARPARQVSEPSLSERLAIIEAKSAQELAELKYAEDRHEQLKKMLADQLKTLPTRETPTRCGDLRAEISTKNPGRKGR